MSDHTWRLIGNVLIMLNATAAGCFAVSYGVFAPWYRSQTGRNIMAVMGVLAINASYFSWAAFRGHGLPASFYPVRAGMFLLLFLVLAQRFIIFVRAQLLAKRANPRSKEIPHVGEVRKDIRDADRDDRDGGSGGLPRVGGGRDDAV
jgi:hypothetical protein